MANVLCTFSGRYGDILWSLPTVRDVATKMYSGDLAKELTPDNKVDMGIMPQYKSLLPLLAMQPYIDKVFTIDNWIHEGSPFGDQPWKSPNFEGREKYKVSFDLTYKSHPYGCCLADWIHKSNGLQWALTPEDIPFIVAEHIQTADGMEKVTEGMIKTPFIAYAFNDQYGEVKSTFLDTLCTKVLYKDKFIPFVRVDTIDWVTAAWLIKHAVGFVGCRSSNYVLAHGVGQRVIVFEPHPSRRAPVFNCPFGREYEVDVATDNCLLMINQWIEEKMNVVNQAESR